MLPDSASESNSPPSSPLAPDQRIYKPLPKRSRLSTDTPRADGERLPTWAHGAAGLSSVAINSVVDEDLHPALDTATNSTENDGDGPPTPPQSNLDPLTYSSIFSSVHHLVKDAAANSTLFSAAAAEIAIDDMGVQGRGAGKGGGTDEDGLDADDLSAFPLSPQRGHGPLSGQFARLAAGLLAEANPPRGEADDLRTEERDRDDDYAARRGGGANKKKRKVPSAANGHAFAASPPASPPPAPAPPSINGVGGLSREQQDTGMRANFATAMVGVVKAMGNLAAGRGAPQGGRMPHSSFRRRRERLKLRPSTKDNLPSTAPPPVLRNKVSRKTGKVIMPNLDTQIQLSNLYDPLLGPAVSVASPDDTSDALALVPKDSPLQNEPEPPAEPPYRFAMLDGDFDFECAPPKVIASRIHELERERIKLRRARELILERARELEAVRQRAIEEDNRSKKLLPPNKNGKIYVEHAMQTDGPEGGRVVWVTPRTAPAPSNAPKKPPPRKGKKKRSAHANANNVHHRDNYVPSRPARSATGQLAGHSTAVPLLRPGASLDLVDPNSPFYTTSPEAHPQLGISMLAPFFAGMDEWLCSFCESRILYGSQSNVSEAIRQRKDVLKVRKRAQERAAKAASGQSTSTLKQPRGKVPRAIPTHDIACGPGGDESLDA